MLSPLLVVSELLMVFGHLELDLLEDLACK